MIEKASLMVNYFIYGILYSLWWNNSSDVTKSKRFLFSLSDQKKKIPLFEVNYHRLTRKIILMSRIHNISHSYWRNILAYSICHKVDMCDWVVCKTSDFNFWLIFLVSSIPSTNTLRSPHSTSINTSLRKSSKFPMSSISRSCSFSATTTIFSEAYLLQLKRDFLWKHK